MGVWGCFRNIIIIFSDELWLIIRDDFIKMKLWDFFCYLISKSGN